MARLQRSLKTKGTDIPPLKPATSRIPPEISEEGLLSFVEIAVGSVIITLLLVVGVSTLRVTEKGTVAQMKSQQALDLAKAKAEEMKSYMSSQGWDNIKVDVRFPPTQTPAVNSYQSYAPTTVTMGKNVFIIDPEVRYVYSDSATQLQFVATPANSATPEYSDLVRIRVDAYYGPPAEFQPLPTAEASNNMMRRMVYSNMLANRNFYVGGVGTIDGYVQSGCPGSPVGGVDVGLYAGAQKIADAITGPSGYYLFNGVQAGIININVVSSPGYNSLGPCNFTNPITLTAGYSLHNQNIVLQPLTTWSYQGIVVRTTPVVTTVPATSPTPVIPVLTQVVPIPGAIVFANDGNSLPVTADAGGNFTITQVRATPVAGHNYDTIEADDIPGGMMGKNYNVGSAMYPSCGFNCIGPITIFLQSPLSGTIPVTFVMKDEDGSNINGGTFYPATVFVADGSVTPPSGQIPSGSNSVTLNVHPGSCGVSLLLQGNTAPPSYSTFNQTLILTSATVTQPVTMLNYSVGSMAGTVAGMGASFDYALFTIRARDNQGQFAYNIPVVYNGTATFGTFSYKYLRTPAGLSPRELNYNFTADGGGDYTSTQESQIARQGTNETLDNPILVSLLNVYMSVKVNKGGRPYPYGAWVSGIVQQVAPTPTPSLPTTQGPLAGLVDYFSTVTGGDGSGNLQVQLRGGVTTNYTVYAQITDPTNNYAVTTIGQTVSVGTGNTPANPQGVTFNF